MRRTPGPFDPEFSTVSIEFRVQRFTPGICYGYIELRARQLPCGQAHDFQNQGTMWDSRAADSARSLRYIAIRSLNNFATVSLNPIPHFIS